MTSQELQRAWDHLAAGGPVMVPLLLLCLWMWMLIVSRLLELSMEALREHRGASGSDSGWKQAMHRTFSSLRTGSPSLDLALAGALAAEQIRRRNRHVKTISVLAATAPLLGLLGTVTGMISTFDGMARFGTGNARVMASGISQAMITTQAGLIIALPGLFMGNFLRRRSDNMARKISTYATGLVGAGRASHPPLTAELPHGH